MDQRDDTIMTMFVEGTREHLADIESSLLDMERGGAVLDAELVNKVFRAAHSIKGGASYLNLHNIRNLAHRLENLLHMVRSREVVPDTRLINHLLAGFDRLRSLVESAPTSDAEDITDILQSLAEATAAHLPEEARAEVATLVPIAWPGGEPIFFEDALSLHQAVSGGKTLYLVEYDLIHDVQAVGKTPFDIITTMEASGLIVDCRMELGAVGDLDAPPVNRIPFYVLFASVVEPDIVGYLFALDPAKHIRPVDLSSLSASAPVAQEQSQEMFGPFALTLAGETSTLSLPDGAAAEAGFAREALLAGLAHGTAMVLDWNDPAEVDLALLQVVLAAGRTYAARGLSLTHRQGPPHALVATAERAGVTPEALTTAGVPVALLFPA